ncbi:MAG: HD domain-containing protein [Phycisphaerales bacterium]|nr:HD domain-containing protein [Phycisphaerales bacterium]
MLRVPIVQARPGMRLAFPVYRRNQPDTVLLRAGFELDQVTIDRLEDMKIAEIWIEYPGLEFIGRHISPAITHQRVTLMRLLGETIERMHLESTPHLAFNSYKSAMRSLVKTLRFDRSAAMMVNSLQEAEAPIQRHSSDVCYLALLMGLAMDSYLVMQRQRLNSARAKDVVNLGLAGMFHDIGMVQLPHTVVQRWESTGDEQDPAWRQHVRLGYELVREDLPAPASVAVLHHHQAFNGSGFPDAHGELSDDAGLAGEAIHVYARILAAADLYDRLRHPPGTAPVPAVRALSRLQQPGVADRLDPRILEGLLVVVPPYPPGAIVRLNNGDPCVVVQWHPDEPCRPTVQVLGEDLLRLGPAGYPRHELKARPDLWITHIDDECVEQDNFYTTRARQYGLVPEGLPRMPPDADSGKAA